MSNMTDLWLSGVFLSSKYSKFVFGRGSAPDPAEGAYDAPPDHLVGWGGGQPLPIPSPLDALASVARPQHKFLATPMIAIAVIITLS